MSLHAFGSCTYDLGFQKFWELSIQSIVNLCDKFAQHSNCIDTKYNEIFLKKLFMVFYIHADYFIVIPYLTIPIFPRVIFPGSDYVICPGYKRWMGDSDAQWG